MKPAAAAALLALSACASAPDPAAAPGAFGRALAEGYGALADLEFAESDFLDGRRFRARQHAALAGDLPEPDDLTARDFTYEERAAFLAERDRLIAAADEIARLVAPQLASEAQVNFDCWVQEAEERLDQPELAVCRDAYFAALEALGAVGGDVVILLPDAEGAAVTVSGGGAKVTLDAPFAAAQAADGVTAIPPLSATDVARALGGALDVEPERYASYTVYFETGSAGIVAESLPAFEAAVADALSRTAARVTALGHTDRVGSDAVNVRVSRRRAVAIADALTEREVPAEAISTDSFGERRPLVPTTDGVAEPLNRRVEIIVR